MKKITILILILVVAGTGIWYWQKQKTYIFCGGIAGIECPSGYSCRLEGSYPDAGGTCIKDNQKNDSVCIQVITPARNLITGEVKDFATPCNVPIGWQKI